MKRIQRDNMTKKLVEYNEKRDFEKTLEPQGQAKKSDKNLKFVIQLHMARAKHYDFRLEWEGVLLSWAVPKGPSYNSKDKRLAVKVLVCAPSNRHLTRRTPIFIIDF